MKRLISAGNTIVDETCKSYLDNFITYASCIEGIQLLMEELESISILKDQFLGDAAILSFNKADFLIYLNPNIKLIQVSANEKQLMAEFKDNILCVNWVKSMLDTFHSKGGN